MVLTVDLTNPDVSRRRPGGSATRHAAPVARKFLRDGVCYERLRFKNYRSGSDECPAGRCTSRPTSRICSRCAAPNATAAAKLAEPSRDGAGVVLGYRGLDGVTRRTMLASRGAGRSDGREARFDVALAAARRD